MKRTIIINESQVKYISNLMEGDDIETKVLRGYSFDWDDNILYMPTVIKMIKYDGNEWKPVEVSTHTFSKVRDDKNYKLDDDAFYNFREEKEFTKDLKKAIPDKTLEVYLDSIDYHPVSSEHFSNKFGTDFSSAINPEENKKIAFRDYVGKVINGAKQMVGSNYNKLSIGFSDDDLGNINAMIEFIKNELQEEFPDTKFIIYDTSKGTKEKIVVKKV